MYLTNIDLVLEHAGVYPTGGEDGRSIAQRVGVHKCNGLGGQGSVDRGQWLAVACWLLVVDDCCLSLKLGFAPRVQI